MARFVVQVGELKSENPVVKAKAVVAVRDLLVAPTKHIQCIAAGITPALVDMLKVRRSSVSSRASSVFHPCWEHQQAYIAGHKVT